ncbi:uncharacterized protein LOC119969033 [Scyliorhinus canicula]|uniref:uncharacterized protein LOC119969033 n=1 Tax=Scyliorhinus canicula TaxID=7830 RepID=UPI0018F6AB48|nr:uncharacterized protein LOC119969033 [Scyliorhinus canicula]
MCAAPQREMNAFKISTIWQEGVAKNFSKLFSSNKSVEEDSATNNTSERESPKDEQTAVNPKDGHSDDHAFSGSATKLRTDVAKAFHSSVDQERSSAQERPTANEAIAVFPLNNMGEPQDGIRQKLGSFFSRGPKSGPDHPLPQSRKGSVSSPDLNTENQDGAHIPNWNSDAENEPLHKHIMPVPYSDAGKNGKKTRETGYPASPATEHIFSQAESVELDNSEIAHSRATRINSSTSGQYKGIGRSEEKLNDSACLTNPVGLQKLRKFRRVIPLEKDVGAVRTEKDAVYRKTRMKPHTVAGEHKEMDSQVFEVGADEADSSENEKDIPVPPTVTYSTYRGARRIRRRRCQRKPFQPLCPIISEVDERSVISLVDQPLINQMKEEINHCGFLQAPTMTEIQTPSEEKVPIINNGKGNSELEPRINIVKFPSNKAGLAQDAKTENEPQTQQMYSSGVSREIELTGPHYQESSTKVESECSPVTTGTINSTKEQILQPDTSVSNIPRVQKISAVNPDDISVPGRTMTHEHLHSNGSAVPKRDTQHFIQLLTDHNDKSHRDEYHADITASKITAQTDSPSKTTIQMDPQQMFHVPSASKAIRTKGNEADVPKAHCPTTDAVEAATTQNLKPSSLNNVTPLTETDQQIDNTDWKRKSIVANSEAGALAVPVVICSKQDDMEKETEKSEPVSESEKQGLVREIFDNATDPTKNVSFTNPVKTIHLCNELDTPKVILNDNYDAQLKIASSTQTDGHTTVSGHFAVFNNEVAIPDASTNDMPKEYKNKDNVTGLTTRSLTADTGYAIEKLLKEYSQTTQWKSVPDTIQVNEESSSEVLEKQMSKDSSRLTTVEARTEDTATSTNVTNESTVVIENDKHLKIPSATVSKIAADTGPSAMQSYGVNNSESTITTESPENSEASSLENEGSLYAQKPDQLFKISPVKEHDHTSESLAGTLASSLEPKLSKAIKPSLANESVFYRYYQESTVLFLDSAKNAHSIANSETATVQAVEENQSVEEIQDNKEASNFVAMPKDAIETSISTSKCSQSGNSLWYRCFQQSTGLLNTRESTQPNIISESNLGLTQFEGIAELAKPIALEEKCGQEAIQSTLHGDSLNNSRMAYSNEQNEEMAKQIKSYDNWNANATNSGKPEDEETASKIKGKKEELITMQSRAELITETCTVDESQAHPVERVIATDSDSILEGATKEVEEEIISSAVRVTPHTQLSTTVIKEDVTNTQIDLDTMKTARLVDTKDDDLNENTNNVTMNNTIKEEPVELMKTVQVNDEQLMRMEQSDIQGKSENYSRQITGEERQDKPLVTHENVSENVASVYRADVKDVLIMMGPQEKSISLAPLMPMGTDLTLIHAAKDVRNQEEGSGLLKLTSTSQATGSTESAFKTIGVKVNDGEVGAEDPVKETEQRIELSKNVIAAEDSLSEKSSEIMKTENNSDHMAQEFSAALSEQCNIIDPTQSTAVLTTDSVKSTQSNDTQENVVSDFGKSQPNPEANHFQSGSVELKIGQSSLSTDQNNSSNLTTKSEDGTCMISETPQSSNISLSDSVKPANEVEKRMILTKIISAQEAIPNIQLPDVARVSLSDMVPATESNMTSPPVSKSDVGLVTLSEPVTPHTQTCSVVNKDDVTTAETASDITKAAMLMERVNAVDLNKNTNNLPIDNTIDEEPEELGKTVEVNVERVKDVVLSEITEESENTLRCTSGGERQEKPLVTHENVSENVPSVYRADVKDVSIVMEPQEKSISLAPLLPVDTDLSLIHAAKDVRNQEEGSGLLNLTSTSQATGSTESAFKTIGVKVNDCEVGAEDPVKETEQRIELSKNVIVAEDSLSEKSSEIMKTENNSDHMAQEFSAALSEQCNIDPTQSTAVLTTDSVKSTQSNDTQENVVSDFGKSQPNSEANHFQSGFVELKINQSRLSTDQNDSSHLTTKSENGLCMISETPQSSNITLSDSVKPVNEVKKRKIQKIILSAKGAIPNIQLTDVAQVSLSDMVPATESNMTSPPVSKSDVGLGTLSEPVTPHTQTCSIINIDDVTTAETASDITKAARLMERVNAVDLNKNTNNLPIDNTIDEEPEELGKTVEINVERVKDVVYSESENTLRCTSAGERQDKPLAAVENVSENLPSFHRANVKDVSIAMEPQEKGISLAPLLPMATDFTLIHAAKDVRNQEEVPGLLNLTSTSQATGSTESAFKTIGVKMNDGEVGAEDPVKETEQRTELSKNVIAAEDSLSETSSEIMKTENNTDYMAEEFSVALSEQFNIIDPTQSTAVLTTDSVKSTQSNDVHGNSIAVFEKSKSGQLADPGGFTNESMKDVEGVETGRNTEPHETFDFFARSADVLNGHATESTETTDHIEREMELQYLEQEALILDTPSSHSINRRRIYPYALSPIYEEQELEDDETMDMYNMTYSPTLTTEYNSNQCVTSMHEPIATTLQLMQTENVVQEIEEEKQNPTGSVSALEVSTSVSSDHLQKATIISHAINEKQNLSSPPQTETCLDGSNDSPKPKSSAAGDSIFYRYFQSSEDYLTKVEKALPESESKMFTDLQQKPVEGSNLLKCSPDSKCLVKNKSLKINPRPGKVVIYDQLNFHGNKREIFTDIPDATNWGFSAGISFQSVRGCWMLCEKPDFQGQTHVLEEGQGELNELWIVERFQKESTPTKIVIGSIKRIVKNHSIPEIAILQEPQQDDIKTFLHSEVTCFEECGITPSVSSIIVNSGIWFAYYMENFSGRHTLLETGNSSVPLTSEVKSNNIKSLRPLEMGGLKVERPMAPQVTIFEKTFFNGRFKEICEDASDLKNLWEDGFKGVGSVRVIGGVWVCYEKECYRGHQYLLEEGEYENWQAWGGFDSTVQSMRFIQADYMKSEIILFEEADLKKGNDAFVTHAIPHLESIGYGTETRSIEVKNGVWVAYHEEHYSGEQYILEKGVYRNYTGWGGRDSSITSIRPIQLEPVGGNETQFQLRVYNRIDFQGESVEFITEIPSLPSLQPNSFKVSRGCWVLYDEKDYNGCQYVLEEGQYRDLDSLGCLSAKLIKSLKPIRTDFSLPSISLFSLYSFEGQELILTEGTSCWKNKDYYQTPKSVKVNGGTWVAYEYANYRGKQLLLDCTEITNWNKFSGWNTIGSVHPLKQLGVYFRVKNKATGGFVTVVGGFKDPRESKLTVCPYNGKPTQMWCYCHGLIKSKANSGCIAAIGGHVKAGAKVNLWTEHGRTHQKWNINRDGTISSFLDSNLRLDIKGGDFYDKDHIILNFPGEQQQSQFWDIEVLR